MNNTIININNLGTIKNSSFGLKPLTILCGCNNINKHMVMYATYQLCRNQTITLDEQRNTSKDKLIDIEYYDLFKISDNYENIDFSFQSNNLNINTDNNILLLPIERNAIISEYTHNSKHQYYNSPTNDYFCWIDNLFGDDCYDLLYETAHFPKLTNWIERYIDGKYIIKFDTFVF